MCATPRRLKKNVTRLVTIRNMARYKNYKPLFYKTATRGAKSGEREEDIEDFL